MCEHTDIVPDFKLSNTPENFFGGQTVNFLSNWEKVTSDPWVLTNAAGIEIPLIRKPIQTHVPKPYTLRDFDPSRIDAEIVRMLEKGVIEEVEPEQDQWISSIFAKEKANGDIRIILDLSDFNKVIPYEHFKMDNLQTALELVRQGWYMSSIDLKDAYYTFPICHNDRKYLKFVWGNVLYQYRVIPNGVACAPRIFTKLLAPIFCTLREQGCEAFPYIDDTFILGSSYEECLASTIKLAKLFDDLGLVIHPIKSVMTPATSLEFLGFVIDSEKMTVSLTEKKVEKVIQVTEQTLENPDLTIREVAGLVGLFNAYAKGVEYGMSHYKALERCKNKALKLNGGNYEASMTLSNEAVEDICWWANNVVDNCCLIRNSQPDLSIDTDASMQGWGAYLGDHTIGGRWLPEEQNHINVLELRAINLALHSLGKVMDVHVHIRTDNMTALHYVSKMGGVKSPACDEVARTIWGWAEARRSWLTVSFVPGVLNIKVDKASRVFNDNLEWRLNDRIFKRICKIWGNPKWDLFASRTNFKCERYCSWKPDPGATHVDSLTMSWKGIDAYAFPPFSLVSRVLRKLEAEEPSKLVLVVPDWPGRAWYPRALKLATASFKVYPRNANLLGRDDSLGRLALRVLRF